MYSLNRKFLNKNNVNIRHIPTYMFSYTKCVVPTCLMIIHNFLPSLIQLNTFFFYKIIISFKILIL